MPSAAERARTLVENNSSAVVTIPGLATAGSDVMAPVRRSVGPTGDVFLLLPDESPAVRVVRAAGGEEIEAVLEITDVAPVAVPHRIRGRAWVAGWLTPVPGGAMESGTTLLRLETGEISLDDLWGAALVEPDEFADAAADPLAEYESELLQHLAAAHSAQVGLLCALVGRHEASCDGVSAGSRPPLSAVPLALDRFGLRVRFTGDNSVFDARFDFPEPVCDRDGLRRSMHALFDAARDS
ncbi:DUF2470 domain-containing protein [Streptomyces sp. CBMA29]|uniref:DUF2470 domain-containing protein n=1 Tax=Streptomyces sp. CBMA29 TaxID=1896314 RepID=UPI001661BF64|nr:DUF2470 domain-containing protein [Streptomyces sp. CBMA29]MBD0739720.1 DUF2470 domain-containing protein [Streptomyces sp. CBMA29]